MKSKRKKCGALQNCLGCGRDTTSVSGYCSRCLGHESRFNSQINDRKDRPVDNYSEIAEDDYSEESNADSIH